MKRGSFRSCCWVPKSGLILEPVTNTIESVDQYYDETIYQALIDEYAAVYEETRESLREKVRLLDARLLADELEAEDD